MIEADGIEIEITSANVRIPGGPQTRLRFTILGDENLAILKMGEGELCEEDRRAIARELKRLGFKRVSWNRHREDGSVHRVEFPL